MLTPLKVLIYLNVEMLINLKLEFNKKFCKKFIESAEGISTNLEAFRFKNDLIVILFFRVWLQN